MGTHHEDGYSANVEGFFVVDGRRIRLAKTNGRTIVLAEDCEIEPGAEGDLLVIVDGAPSTRRICIPDGVFAGQTLVQYEVSAPF